MNYLIFRTLNQLVCAIEECVTGFIDSAAELANLYEISSQYELTIAGEDRTFELRKAVNEKRKELQDLELLFAYVKKLMDANSEVTFLLNAEYASTQTSQNIHNATKYVEEKFNSVRLLELELAQAQKVHIEKMAKKDLKVDDDIDDSDK